MQKNNKVTKDKIVSNITENHLKIPNSKKKDSSAKLIFGDPVLCAQFLEGYVDIPLLKNVKPEDIEDVSKRYIHMFTEERNSDIVKRVLIKDKSGEKTPFYIISLIEHKNHIDYNVSHQQKNKRHKVAFVFT